MNNLPWRRIALITANVVMLAAAVAYMAASPTLGTMCLGGIVLFNVAFHRAAPPPGEMEVPGEWEYPDGTISRRPQKGGLPGWAKVVIVMALVIYLLSCCPGGNTSSGKGQAPEASEASAEAVVAEPEPEKTEEKEATKYMEKVQWAALQDYMCAVEVDDYPGDKLRAGKYRAYPSNTERLFKKDVPIVWALYASSEYGTASRIILKEEDCVGYVGGWNDDEASFELKKGQYLYVDYTDMAGRPIGILNIERVDD